MERTKSRKTIAFAAVVTMSIAVVVSVPAQTSVWYVSSGDTGIFLGGTFHLLRPADYPLPEEFEKAYEKSQIIYFETDLLALEDPNFGRERVERLLYPDGTSLEEFVTPETYRELTSYFQRFELPEETFRRFRPGLLVSTLEAFEFLRMGFQAIGVDAHFNDLAIADGKRRAFLETPQEQIDLIAGLGSGYEDDLIRAYLDDIASYGESIDRLVQAWRSGDMGLMTELFVLDLQTSLPPMYESLVVRRNAEWLPEIIRMFEDPEIEFVLVGAGHLPGPDGLLVMLEERGFQIERF